MGASSTADSQKLGSGTLGTITELTNVIILGFTKNNGKDMKVTIPKARVTSPLASTVQKGENSTLEVTFESLVTGGAPKTMPMWIEIETDFNVNFFGPLLWLKADAITGLSDNDPVAAWNDSSDNGNNATQSVVANKPIYKAAAINGEPAIQFNDATEAVVSYFNLSGVDMGSAFTVLLVVKPLSFPPGLAYGEFIVDANTDNGIFIDSTAYDPVFSVVADGYYCIGGTPTVGVCNVVVFDPTHVYVDGVDATVDISPVVDFTGIPMTIIGSNATNAASPHVLVPEIIIFGSVLSNGDRAQIEQYLANKYAITLS